MDYFISIFLLSYLIKFFEGEKQGCRLGVTYQLFSFLFKKNSFERLDSAEWLVSHMNPCTFLQKIKDRFNNDF